MLMQPVFPSTKQTADTLPVRAVLPCTGTKLAVSLAAACFILP